MNDVEPYGAIVAIAAVLGVVAVLSNRLGQRARLPAPAIFLLGAAVAAELFPSLHTLSDTAVQRIVTVALAVILFDGGMHIGRRRFQGSAGVLTWVGVVGTLATAFGVAVLAHLLFGFGWLVALLIGTALAPTDPAVVFSVLGRREIAGRTGTILEGESGVNDPVGIALMAALLTSTGGGLGSVLHGLEEFVLQMAIGGAVGVAGGVLLLQFIRRVPLPSEGLYLVRTLACALALYGLATVAHGSGFLAVLVAGIMIGDADAPYKREIVRFHGALASLGEIVAFTVLGLSVGLGSMPDGHAWQIGLVLAVLLALVVRPLLVGAMLLPVRLRAGERVFVAWAGLKGAVPVLLGTFIVSSGVVGGDTATRVYDIIFVVVAFSVIVQGGSVPWLAGRCRVPMRIVEPEPWSVGARLREQPDGVHRYVVAAGAPADGEEIADLALGEHAWVSMVVRAGALIGPGADTTLRAGDEIIAFVDPACEQDPGPTFTNPGAPLR